MSLHGAHGKKHEKSRLFFELAIRFALESNAAAEHVALKCMHALIVGGANPVAMAPMAFVVEMSGGVHGPKAAKFFAVAKVYFTLSNALLSDKVILLALLTGADVAKAKRWGDVMDMEDVVGTLGEKKFPAYCEPSWHW